MREAPSLMSLTTEAIKRQLILCEDDDGVLILQDIYEIPSHLFDVLVAKLPPLALHKLQMQMPYKNLSGCDCSDGSVCSEIGRKRSRSLTFDAEWKMLFKSRWPSIGDSVKSDDWHQTYWEKHLQNCVDEAAGSAMVLFNGRVGEIKVPDYIMECIGCEEHVDYSTHSKLSCHFQQFARYVRSLGLQGVLCVAETCKLLRNSQLQSLTARWIRSGEHVDGLCQLLIQNRETLESLELRHSLLSSTFVDAICRSLLGVKHKQTHGIKNFSIMTSVFLEAKLNSLPPSLESFLSSGRSLSMLRFSNNHLDKNFAQILFTLLLDSSSSVSILNLSGNRIAGWLSNFSRGTSSQVPSSLGICKSLLSLRVLNLRDNNLQKDDMERLRHALLCMPNLEILDLGENPIEDEGIRCLVPYFADAVERCSPLMVLILESCELSCEGATLLLDTLTALHKPLNSLTLADNSLGSPIAGALGKLLCSSIQELNIEGIGLGSAGFQELQKGMMEELALVKINISKNRGGLETARFLLKLISRAPHLVAVNASHNLMPAESLTLVCSALKAAKGKLQLLDLAGNTWKLQQMHNAILTEMQHSGIPTLILPSMPAQDIPYDDDP